MIGQIVSHYKILEKLGEGGMGIVYRAHDTKLDRTVALKFLPPQVSATDQDKTRFTQEARAAAALNHPHICHIYRIDEVDAPPSSGRTGEKLMFIEMEHVDGVTLRKKIAEGPMALADALNLATQIGEGLEEAHSKGIIHRDIKSDNVMLNARHQAKVMDFGLAKLKGALKLTRSSSTVGTLAYMAPEQLRGVEADARSDIFSFGVLFYEMLTGRVPFEGAHEAALMYSITNEPPTPLEKYIPDAPAELLHIINRSLEKDPEDRYQTVHDMVIDIRRMKKDSTRVSQSAMPRMQTPQPGSVSSDSIPSATSGVSGIVTPQPTQSTPTPPPVSETVPVTTPPPERRTSSVTIQIPTGGKSWMMIAAIVVAIGLAVAGYMQFSGSGDSGGKLSIAVADFQNRTNEPELDGLSGMLTTAMEQSKRLSVVTRSHMFDILKQMGKGDLDKIDEATGKEICARAGIGALVTASIQKLGKLYIIDLKVVDPTKNDYLFTAKEEGEGQESIPAMLDNLSEKTRAGLKEKADEINNSSAELAVVTTKNMEAYQHFFKGEELLNKLDMEAAEEEFRKAVALDSLFGLAWYRLAYVVDWAGLGGIRQNDAMPMALSLIDRLPEKERYLLRAVSARSGATYVEAVKILRDMEKHYPNEKEMVYNIGDWSYHDNDLVVAAEYLNKTLTIDPTHERALQHLSWVYRGTGQYEKMLEIAHQYEDVAHSNESLNLMVEAYLTLGLEDRGISDLTEMRKADPGRSFLTVNISQFLRLSGKVDEAREELETLTASGDSGAVRQGNRALTQHFEATGQYTEAVRAISDALRTALARNDTSQITTMHIGRAFAEYFLTESLEKVAEYITKARAYPVSPTNLDYWFPVTWLEIVIHPERDFNPLMKGKIWTPVFDGIQASLLENCTEAATAVDSASKLGVAPAVFISGYYLAGCYYRAARYNDALAALNRALGERSMYNSPQYPLMILRLGKIQEEMGNKKMALESYRKFLTLWEKADSNLPALIDAKKRLAKLEAVASN